MDIINILILVGFSALFSGLTLGFFSLNKDDLERKMKLGDASAKKIFSVRKNGNLLLCTLLIGNVAINSALSIFLGSIVSGFTAGIIATSIIVIFGEIIPQATFSRYALELGVKVVWVVKIFIIILFPICWPLAWLLDKILGDEMPSVYSRKELIKIIEEHERSKDSKVDEDEEKIIKGALSFSDKIVNNILTPRVEIFSLPMKRLLDKKTIKEIKESGHSRIPIYQDSLDDIAGILYVKDLIGNDFKDKTAQEVMRENVIYVDYNKKLDDLLNAFKANRQHLFIVVNEYGELSGLVSIEDVIEEIIGAEIMDEDDKFADLQAEARKKMKKKKINKI